MVEGKGVKGAGWLGRLTASASGDKDSRIKNK